MTRRDRGASSPDLMFVLAVVLLIASVGILFRAGPMGRRLAVILAVILAVLFVLRVIFVSRRGRGF